jgi:hypothetical protein
VSTPQHAAQQHQVIEVRFRSETSYREPFRDVTLDVEWCAPGGQTLVVPAFWAGEQDWCVRYASAQTGTHTFRTRCSDEGNSGLHVRVGQVEIEPYRGDNPLYRHGAPNPPPPRRHFCHADGTPFFWLGDTWWMGLCGRLSWPDFQALAQNRKGLGFNVIQLVAGLYPDMPLFDERGRSDSGFCWETDLSRINPRFFDEADQRIFHLVEQGLTPCILGAWGYYLPMIGLENMRLHWRYLMARWGALPVVWAAAGEQTLPWYLEDTTRKPASRARLLEDWSSVIRHMHTLNAFERLITTHPVESARASVAGDVQLDFEMQQTGHGAPTAHHAARARQGWAAQPAMPVISGESRYEALEIDPTVTPRDVREAFWSHTLLSGLAGHTYGANGVWQVNTPERPFGASPSGRCWGNTPLQDAMQLPGARQLGLARHFLGTLDWATFEPPPAPPSRLETFLTAHPRLRKLMFRLGWRPMPPAPMALAFSRNGKQALAYTVTREAFGIDLRAMKGKPQARWVDPTCFEAQGATLEFRDGRWFVRPPHHNAAGDPDWLLVLHTP